MVSRKAWFDLQLAALWLSIVVLSLITSFALITSSTRSDCASQNNATSAIQTTISVCTSLENISSFVHERASYIQSLHIIVIQAIAAVSLLIFRPSLYAMLWFALETHPPPKARGSNLTMKTFQNGVELVCSPGLMSAVVFAANSKTLTLRVFFVLVICILSILSPIAVSPIYRTHQGPHPVTARVVVGGGIGVPISPSFNSADWVAGGVSAGRALINAGTSLGVQLPLATFNLTAAPFLLANTVRAIWNTQVQTVVAYNDLDCGPSAPTRLSDTIGDLVNLGPRYWDQGPNTTIDVKVLFAGQSVGLISNDPQITVAYLNASTSVVPGSRKTETSVVFLAANGTLEGAHLTITSPSSTSRIPSVDVLVCTSTTTLVISDCVIDRGSVTSCQAVDPQNLPAHGLDNFINNPKYVSIVLAASPVTAFYNRGERLPMYDPINQDLISSRLPPLSSLTFGNQNISYSIPLEYITDVLFPQTAQGLVQGIASKWQVYSTQPVQLISTFGTSQPALPLVIFILAIICALAATLASTLPKTAKSAEKLDVTRLLAISRNPQLDPSFEEFSDRHVEIHDSVQDIRVGYQYVDQLRRRALVLDPEGLPEAHDSSDAILLNSSNVVESPYPTADVRDSNSGYGYDYGNDQAYAAIEDVGSEDRYYNNGDFDPRELMLGDSNR